MPDCSADLSKKEDAPDGIRSVTNRSRASRNGAVVFAVVVFVLAFGIVLAAAQAAFAEIGLVALVSAAIVGWLASSSVHIVLEWEKAVVLRFGKFNRVAGPGIVFTWPIVEFYTLRVDQRVSATYFGAEETLTSDLARAKFTMKQVRTARINGDASRMFHKFLFLVI